MFIVHTGCGTQPSYDRSFLLPHISRVVPNLRVQNITVDVFLETLALTFFWKDQPITKLFTPGYLGWFRVHTSMWDYLRTLDNVSTYFEGTMKIKQFQNEQIEEDLESSDNSE